MSDKTILSYENQQAILKYMQGKKRTELVRGHFGLETVDKKIAYNLKEINVNRNDIGPWTFSITERDGTKCAWKLTDTETFKKDEGDARKINVCGSKMERMNALIMFYLDRPSVRCDNISITGHLPQWSIQKTIKTKYIAFFFEDYNVDDITQTENFLSSLDGNFLENAFFWTSDIRHLKLLQHNVFEHVTLSISSPTFDAQCFKKISSNHVKLDLENIPVPIDELQKLAELYASTRSLDFCVTIDLNVSGINVILESFIKKDDWKLARHGNNISASCSAGNNQMVVYGEMDGRLSMKIVENRDVEELKNNVLTSLLATNCVIRYLSYEKRKQMIDKWFWESSIPYWINKITINFDRVTLHIDGNNIAVPDKKLFILCHIFGKCVNHPENKIKSLNIIGYYDYFANLSRMNVSELSLVHCDGTSYPTEFFRPLAHNHLTKLSVTSPELVKNCQELVDNAQELEGFDEPAPKRIKTE